MRLEISLLDKIVGALRIDKRGTGAPNISLGGPDQVSERHRVAARRCASPILRCPGHTGTVPGNYLGIVNDRWA